MKLIIVILTALLPALGQAAQVIYELPANASARKHLDWDEKLALNWRITKVAPTEEGKYYDILNTSEIPTFRMYSPDTDRVLALVCTRAHRAIVAQLLWSTTMAAFGVNEGSQASVDAIFAEVSKVLPNQDQAADRFINQYTNSKRVGAAGGMYYTFEANEDCKRVESYLRQEHANISDKNPLILTIDNNFFLRIVRLNRN